MRDERLLQVALTLIPGIGPVQARILVQHFGNASAIFTSSIRQLQVIEGIGELRAARIKEFRDFVTAEKEMNFITQNGIVPYFFTDEIYPKRLLNCYDAPVLFFFKGNASLNAKHVVTIVGSRKHTEYGRHLTDQLVSELAVHDVTIVSGLAYGIDALAHKAALKNNIPTIGILAHGLDQLYPPQHLSLAKEMMLNGGLLSEFRNGTSPDRHNFPSRNRIAAGIADATIVIETAAIGGSMITAEIAHSYNRDVFAFPGRATDQKSEGCNKLIRENKAALISNAADLLQMMGWHSSQKKINDPQRRLFIELTEHEKLVVDLIDAEAGRPLGIDEIQLRSQLPNSLIAIAILNLELKNVIVSLPGKSYQLS
jgi:DNA processing protein